MENKKEMFKTKESLVNKLLTVKYQNLSETGVPRFPVGITIRDVDLQG